MSIRASFQKMKALTDTPLDSEREKVRVEIIMLKFKESPEIIDKAVTRILHNTDWPFKLNVFDNRPLEGVENNRNTSRIWNKLVQDSTCPYVLIIDSDAYIPATKTDPCWLTRLMESIDETGLVIPVSSKGGGAHQHVNGPGPYGSAVRNKDAWSGYCFLFSKEAYAKVGPFDERFYIYGQDSEWAIRAGRTIGGAVMRKDVFVEHIGSASFSSDPDREDDKLYAGELYKFLTKKR
jgi:hypothetical protein